MKLITCRYRGAIWCALAASGWVTLEVRGEWARMGLGVYSEEG